MTDYDWTAHEGAEFEYDDFAGVPETYASSIGKPEKLSSKNKKKAPKESSFKGNVHTLTLAFAMSAAADKLYIGSVHNTEQHNKNSGKVFYHTSPPKLIEKAIPQEGQARADIPYDTLIEGIKAAVAIREYRPHEDIRKINGSVGRKDTLNVQVNPQICAAFNEIILAAHLKMGSDQSHPASIERAYESLQTIKENTNLNIIAVDDGHEDYDLAKSRLKLIQTPITHFEH